MESKLYVGNLPYSATEEELKTLFGQAGTVTSVAIIKDRETGRSKGFAFVEIHVQCGDFFVGEIFDLDGRKRSLGRYSVSDRDGALYFAVSFAGLPVYRVDGAGFGVGHGACQTAG